MKLTEMFEAFADEKPVLVNPYYLTDAYLPEKLLFRDEEMKILVRHASDFLFHQIPKNVVVYGPPGVGKSNAMKLLVKSFNEIAEEKGYSVRAIYLTVKDLTYYKTLYKISEEIGVKVARGMSLSDLQLRLANHLSQTNNRYLIVLDEVDKMHKPVRSSKDPLDDVVYTTSRINERVGKISVSMFIITNNPRVVDELSGPSYSSLSPLFVYFRDYTVDELKEILRDRIQKAFSPGSVDDSVVHLLATLIRRDSRDLRWAFQVLRVSPLYAENGKITETSIFKAIKNVENSTVEQIVKNLDIDYLLVLLSLMNIEKQSVTSSELFKKYKEMCRKYGWRPKTMKHIIHYITPRLESLGLISRTLVSHGRYGRSYNFTVEERSPEIAKIVEAHVQKKLSFYS